jgi:hypothetical protein
MGALRKLRGGDGVNLRQLMVQHIHSIGVVVARSLGLELGGGEVHH